MKKTILLSLSVFVLFSCNNTKNASDAEVMNNPAENTANTDNHNIVTPAKESATTNTKIKFKEEIFDFKDVKKNAVVRHIFTFVNEGDQPLILSNVSPSCGCTTPTYTKEPVAPGKEGSVTVEFDPQSFHGNVSKSVAISGNFEPTEIKFKANVID